MELAIYAVIFYVLLIDAIGANLMAWVGGNKWYTTHFRIISRYFPITKGWTTYYLLLVLWMGFLLYQFGAL